MVNEDRGLRVAWEGRPDSRPGLLPPGWSFGDGSMDLSFKASWSVFTIIISVPDFLEKIFGYACVHAESLQSCPTLL